jgi:hypothetical protein
VRTAVYERALDVFDHNGVQIVTNQRQPRDGAAGGS